LKILYLKLWFEKGDNDGDWGAHIRIADALIEQGIELSRKEFVIGNLGPDCNNEKQNGLGFDPPKKVTHWLDENNRVIPEKFFQSHIKNNDFEDDNQKAFLIGYYVHLLSDREWWNFISVEMLGKNFFNEINLHDEMKSEFHKDFFQHDKLYFDYHPDSSYHYVIEKLTDIQVYLDYFKEKDFNMKIQYIFDYYKGYIIDKDREFKFINSGLIDEAFEYTVSRVRNILIEKELL